MPIQCPLCSGVATAKGGSLRLYGMCVRIIKLKQALFVLLYIQK